MTLHWPQIAYLALVAMGLGLSLARHGEPKKGTESFPITVVGCFASLWLLWEGGFFGS